MMKKASRVFVNGKVYSPCRSEGGRYPTAVAIEGDRILAVGDDGYVMSFVDEETVVTDLEGRLVLPGFMDSHIHVASSQRIELFELPLGNVREHSLDCYRERIREFVMAPGNVGLKVVYGNGWENGVFAQFNSLEYGVQFARLGPSSQLLDEILKGTGHEETPVLLRSLDGHSLWANGVAVRMAIERFGLEGLMGGCRDGIVECFPGSGRPWGCFREGAGEMVRLSLPEVEYSLPLFERAVDMFESQMHSYGITGVMGVSVSVPFLSSRFVSPLYDVLCAREARGDLSLVYRLAFSFGEDMDVDEAVRVMSVLKERHPGALLQFSSVKIFVDGVVEGRTAWLEEPYVDNELSGHEGDYRGTLVWEDLGALEESVVRFDGCGISMHFHSVGDGATRLTLDCLEKAREVNGAWDSRHAIAHLQLVRDEDFLRMGRLGVVASVQPYWFLKEAAYFMPIEYACLGRKRAESEYPMRSFFEAGVVVASGSDASATPKPSPLEAIEIGVTRNPAGVLPVDRDTLGEDERVSREEMIDSFSVNVAFEMGVEDFVGSIEEGKLANLVVLERDILDEGLVKDWEIASTRVCETVFCGRRVFSLE